MALHEEQPVSLHSLLATSPLTRSLRSNKESLWQSLGSRPTPVQGLLDLAPLLFETAFHYLSIQQPHLTPLEPVSKRIFLTCPASPPPPPGDTGEPDGPLMLRNSFIDFAFEDTCCTTEPG